MCSAFRVVWPAGGALAGGLRFSLDPGPSGFPDLQVSVRRRWRLVSGCGAAWGGCNNSGVGVGVAGLFSVFLFFFSPASSGCLPVWVSPRSGGCPVWVFPRSGGWWVIMVVLCIRVWFGCCLRSVVCPPWLRSCVGLSTVTLPGPELRVPAGVCSWEWCPSTEENSLSFCFAVSSAIRLLDYCFGEDGFHCAALFSSIRVLFLEGNCLSRCILHVSRPYL
ncbi:hypothetical protein RHSIM_Rhsim06G0059300 [Rhododendron simsii]|uniref:Uncharacterized protein n=1 Tax=Rhododendron simsii TaxID=118357 RepID=A0A834H3I9_RHOSS|nr:hypothetical protein RHSIM_Rhsim06G0059300 [Rhododendron simsii]